jgi:hypothetical protein
MFSDTLIEWGVIALSWLRARHSGAWAVATLLLPTSISQDEITDLVCVFNRIAKEENLNQRLGFCKQELIAYKSVT